jgi:hypothetical protein
MMAGLFIIPTLEVLLEYSKNGAAKNPFYNFLAYSIHPVKLILMIFPRFFWEAIFEPYGPMNSSGFDIELYIGIIVFLLSVFSIKYYWKNLYLRLSVVFCAMAFLYAAIGHIPGLREIVYRIPILGGFRVPARSLCIFIFFLYVILAVGITKLSESKELEHFLNFQRKAAIIICFICTVGFLILFTLIHLYGFDMVLFRTHIKLAFMPFMFYMVVFSVLMHIAFIVIKHYFQDDNKTRYNIFIGVLLIITLFETLPFSLMTNSTPVDEVIGFDGVSQRLKEVIGNYKVFDASPEFGNQSIISQNKSVMKKISSINAYIPYNNPFLYKLFSGESTVLLNGSGAMIRSINARNNVLFQNDLLSMLGIKYIIDDYNFIPDNGIVPNLEKKEIIYENAGFDLAPSVGTYTLWSDVVTIKPYHYYMVTFDLDTNAVNGMAYIDLYGDNYDIAESQHQIDITSEHVKVILFSGDSLVCSSDIYLRIVSFETTGIVSIKNLQLFELIPQNPQNAFYEPYIIDEKNRIFENKNACDILYFSDEVRGIDRIDYIIKSPYGLYLNKISYIVDEDDRTYDSHRRSITNIDFRNNEITAVASSEDGAFLNFSQCYFPGWRVYIDGKRSELKIVNGIIMGIDLPPGDHNVEFSFVSMGFLIGLIITCIGLLCLVLFFLYPFCKRKQSNI